VGDDCPLQGKRERGSPGGTAGGYRVERCCPCGGTEVGTQTRGKAKVPRAISQLRARQRKRVAAIRKLNARYAGQTFPKRGAEKWNRLNRELDETEELITELRARYERMAELDDRER
jgi:hypothetical protein